MSMWGIRPAVRGMTAYVPGEKAPGENIILNANENPYPFSPRVAEAIRANIEHLPWYPESTSRDARVAVGEVFGVDPAMVLLSNSADEMFHILTQSVVNDGEIIYAFTPSFTFYKTLANIQHADFREIPFPDDFALPELPADMRQAKIVFFPNPGAPSGVGYELTDIRRILDAAPEAVVVIDEAYADFDGNRRSAVPLLKEYRNLMVVRTFSKSYSLAGMRIGFGIGAPELMAELNKVRDYYNLDRLAQAAAVAALRDQEYMRATCAQLVATRQWFSAELATIAEHVWPSAANFVLARFGKPRAGNLYQKLKENHILVRYWNTPRIDDCLRISIGTEAQMRTVITKIKELLPLC